MSGLNENHRLRLGVVLYSLEKACERIEAALDVARPAALTYHTHDDVTPAEREDLRRIAAALRARLEAFRQEFDLPRQQRHLRRSLAAELATLWMLLEDTHARKLTGRGAIPPEEANRINRHVDALLELLTPAMRRLNQPMRAEANSEEAKS